MPVINPALTFDSLRATLDKIGIKYSTQVPGKPARSLYKRSLTGVEPEKKDYLEFTDRAGRIISMRFNTTADFYYVTEQKRNTGRLKSVNIREGVGENAQNTCISYMYPKNNYRAIDIFIDYFQRKNSEQIYIQHNNNGKAEDVVKSDFLTGQILQEWHARI